MSPSDIEIKLKILLALLRFKNCPSSSIRIGIA
jgi:hypothetical protein